MLTFWVACKWGGVGCSLVFYGGSFPVNVVRRENRGCWKEDVFLGSALELITWQLYAIHFILASVIGVITK